MARTQNGHATLIVGIGNRSRGDDAAGLAVLDLLAGDIPTGAQLVECRGDVTSVLDTWRGADQVILVDAVVSGAEPGTVHRFDGAAALPASWRSLSSHLVGLGEALALGRTLHMMPQHLAVYGIEVGDTSTGAEPSAAVVAAAEEVAAEIRAYLGAVDA
jgi:hydrogenase maturation protease